VVISLERSSSGSRRRGTSGRLSPRRRTGLASRVPRGVRAQGMHTKGSAQEPGRTLRSPRSSSGWTPEDTDKTRLMRFERPRKSEPARVQPHEGPRSFDFLGFTHFWEKSRRGNWVVKRKTVSTGAPDSCVSSTCGVKGTGTYPWPRNMHSFSASCVGTTRNTGSPETRSRSAACITGPRGSGASGSVAAREHPT
jgi:hypothetical protein